MIAQCGHPLPAAARRALHTFLHKLFIASIVFTNGKKYNVGCLNVHTISKENVI